VWTVIGLRSGIWTTGFLVVIPAVTFYFALLYSVSTLTAVFTRSTVVAILATIAVWFGLWLNGTIHGWVDSVRKARAEMENSIKTTVGAKSDERQSDDDARPPAPADLPNWVYTTSDILYKGLPRTGEMNALTAEWVGRGLLSEADQKK